MCQTQARGSILARNVIPIGLRDHIKSALELARGLCYIFVSNLISHVFVISIFFLPDSAFMRNSSLSPYEKVKHYISEVVNFSMDIESGPWLYFTA